MCKYCNETLYRTCEYDDEEMFKSVDKKFCAECGTPLGEVNPLTVEQLREANSDMSMSKWVWIKPIFNSILDSGYYKIHIIGNNCIVKTIANDKSVLWLTKYGTTWIAYTQELKGEAE